MRLIHHDRAAAVRDLLGRARSTMSAVDAEIRGVVGGAQSLVSASLARGDLAAFHEDARRALALQPAWLNIGLATVDKRELMDANRPFGAHAPFSADEPAFDDAVRTRRATVSKMEHGAAIDVATVRVRLPVIDEGEVRYVLSVPIRLWVFDRLLQEQRLPADWYTGVIDGNKRFIRAGRHCPPVQ